MLKQSRLSLPNLRFAIIGNAASTLTNFRAPLIAEIVSRGHKVYALAPDYSPESRAALVSIGAQPVDFPLTPTGLKPWVDLANTRALQSILASLQLDSVLCFGIKPATYGTLAARYAGIRARHVLITGLGYAFIEGGEMSIKRRLVGMAARVLYRYALRQAHTVFMQNADDAADFLRMGIVDAKKVMIVNGTGVELDRWQPAAPVSAPVTFLLAARMLRDKGILEFIEAARTVKKRHPSARFVLIGGLDANPEAIGADQLTDWVNEGIVEWPGHGDMKQWLMKTSVFVLPSYREGVPRSSQEAMAMARPIVTTNVPGCRETVVDGQNGFLVPARCPTALAAAMERFLEHPELINTMGARSRELAVAQFDVRQVNAKMIAAMGL